MRVYGYIGDNATVGGRETVFILGTGANILPGGFATFILLYA
jgi:hypothetical protein